jgi:hypothetical protein
MSPFLSRQYSYLTLIACGDIDYPRRLRARVACGRRVNRRRRRGLAGRLGSEFHQDRPQGMDARRERVTIVSGDVGKLFDQSGGFFVG